MNSRILKIAYRLIVAAAILTIVANDVRQRRQMDLLRWEYSHMLLTNEIARLTAEAAKTNGTARNQP